VTRRTYTGEITCASPTHLPVTSGLSVVAERNTAKYSQTFYTCCHWHLTTSTVEAHVSVYCFVANFTDFSAV